MKSKHTKPIVFISLIILEYLDIGERREHEQGESIETSPFHFVKLPRRVCDLLVRSS